jgi:hypothetical protein
LNRLGDSYFEFCPPPEPAAAAVAGLALAEPPKTVSTFASRDREL